MWNHLWVCSWLHQWTQASIVSSNDKTSYTTNSLVSHESPSSQKANACAIYFNRTKWSCHRNMSDDYIENTGQRELANFLFFYFKVVKQHFVGTNCFTAVFPVNSLLSQIIFPKSDIKWNRSKWGNLEVIYS